MIKPLGLGCSVHVPGDTWEESRAFLEGELAAAAASKGDLREASQKAVAVGNAARCLEWGALAARADKVLRSIRQRVCGRKAASR